jgi:DNA processing protein
VERDELGAWLRLTLTPGVGNASARKLLGAFGLPQAIFEQSAAALRQVVSPMQADALTTTPPELEPLVGTTWKWLQEPVPNGVGSVQRRIVALGDKDYPAALLTIEDPPLMLYLLGTANFESNHPPAHEYPAREAINSIAINWQNSLAVVGSRNPTPQGAANARLFSKALAQAGLCVVSGLALGVDGAAHEGALDALAPGEQRLVTVAVVGTGLDRVYPRSHRELAHRIAQNGLLISEYPLGTPPIPTNFPKRNRLIAGLSQGTLVVEAALKSGSLITARLAAEQGKDVFCHSGLDSLAAGAWLPCADQARCKTGGVRARCAGRHEDRCRPNITPELIAGSAYKTCATSVFDAEDSLLSALGFDPVSLDALQARCGMATAQLQARLMTLELDDQVARLPGGLFQRLKPA